MVQTSTTFDDKLKKKVFVIRGDEGYARSTDVVVSASTPTTSTTYFAQPISINVLRDTGNSQVAVYDGDTVLEIFNWTGSTSATTKTYNLAYGVPHYIKVKYLGNKQCLSSTSKTIEVSMDDPNLYSSTLTYGSSTQRYAGATVSYTLATTGSSSYVNGQTIKLYYDGVLLGTSTTNSSGVATFTLTASSVENGLHNLQAVFEGSANLYGCTKDTQISIGYDISFIKYPDVAIDNANNQFKVLLKDWFGTAVNNATVYLRSGTSNLLNTTTNSSGQASFQTSSPQTSGEYYARYTNSAITYDTPTITSPYFNPTSITLMVSSPQGDTCAVNHSTEIIAVPYGLYGDGTENPISNLDVVFNLLPSSFDATIKTNSNGEARYTYTGTGFGVRDISIMVRGLTAEHIYIYDYLQYWWSQGKKLNQSYNLTNATLNTHYNGWSVRPTTSNKKATMTLNGASDGDWIFEFDVISFKGGASSISICGYTYTSKQPNQKIKVIYQSGQRKVYADNTLLNTASVSNLEPSISSNTNQNNIESRIGIDKVSLRRISTYDPL